MRIPIEMRRRMLKAVERGEPVNAVARRFEVTPQGLRKLIRTVRERGDLSPAKPGPKGPTKLTLNAIREHLSVGVAESTVCRRLRKLGVTLKTMA
ncbi:MAG: helix-turn-helix domain-containing protein [Phycisphaeraceae bacterium]|nr:MAG: helix-turn-helix domain-containing protein [Phycisphaeraceae bacterium]